MTDAQVELVTTELARLRSHVVEELGSLHLMAAHQGDELRALVERAVLDLAIAADYRSVRRQVWAGRLYALLLEGVMPSLLSETLSERVELGVQQLARRTWELVAALEAAEPATVRPDVEGDEAGEPGPRDEAEWYRRAKGKGGDS